MPELPTVDTSSYKQALPAGRSPLDTVQQLGTIQNQQTAIDQNKLKLMNDRFMIINNELSTLANDPSVTHDKILTKMNTLSKMGLIPQNMLEEFRKDLPQDPSQLGRFVEQTLQRGMSVIEKLNYQYGERAQYSTGQQIINRYESPRFGAAPPIQQVEPPTTPYVDPETGQPRTLGPQPYPGVPRGAPLPVGRPAPVANAPLEPLPVAPQQVVPATPIRSQRMGEAPVEMGAPGPQQTSGMPTERVPVARQPQAGLPAVGPQQRQGGGFPIAPPPLFEEGKKIIIQDQIEASARMMRVKPAAQALPLMDIKGFLSGPGSKEWTLLTAGLQTVGFITPEQVNDPTAVRQEVAKKLAQYVAGSPVGQRSDAAQILAEASNPNPDIHTLQALKKLTKDAIILDRVQAAMPQAFKSQDFSKYGQYKAAFPQSIDERAFGLDLDENNAKLVNEMAKELKSDNTLNKNKATKFFRSLRIAKEQGFYQ